MYLSSLSATNTNCSRLKDRNSSRSMVLECFTPHTLAAMESTDTKMRGVNTISQECFLVEFKENNRGKNIFRKKKLGA